MTKDISDIIEQLERQVSSIEQAIAALKGIDDNERGATRRGRPATKKRSRLRPEARERIAAAQRKRWAAQRKAAKRATKKAA